MLKLDKSLRLSQFLQFSATGMPCFSLYIEMSFIKSVIMFLLITVGVCQANGQTMSRFQLFLHYFKTELAPPTPIEAKESIGKFLDLPWKMRAKNIANMNVKVRRLQSGTSRS